MVSRPRSLKRIGPAFGLALIALLAVYGIAPTMALAAKPENTSPPVVSPSTPHIGIVESTTNGTWKGEPTKFSYRWYRCNEIGASCTAISGQTLSTYTPGDADINKTLKAQVTATNSEGSTPVYSNLTKPLTIAPLYWYVGGKKLATGTPTSFSMTSTANFTLRYYPWGAFNPNNPQVFLTCSLPKTEGTLENPASGGVGISSLEGGYLTGCTVKPKTCEGKLLMSNLVGEASEFEGKPAVNFETSEVVFETLVFGEKCPFGYQPNLLGGNFRGILNSETSSVSFTKASSNLYLGGYAAWLESGTAKLETASGETVTLGT